MMTEDHPLARYLLPLRRRWPLLVVAMVAGVGFGWLSLPEPTDPDAAIQVDPTVNYQATHLLLREQITADTRNFDLLVLLARQGEVQVAVEEQLGDSVGPGAVNSVSLETDSDLETVAVTAVQPLPDQAAEVATTYAEVMTRYFDERAAASAEQDLERVNAQLESFSARIDDLEEELGALDEGSVEQRMVESELEALLAQYGNLQSEAQGLNATALGGGTTFSTLQEPSPIAVAAGGSLGFEVPEAPWIRLLLAAVSGLIVGLLAIFAIDWMDTRIRTRGQAEEAFGLPVIVELPKRPRRTQREDPLPVVGEPSSAIAEGFRTLRLSLSLAPRWLLDRNSPIGSDAVGTASPIPDRGRPRSIVVTSVRDGEGKSTVVANLALSFAETGLRVLVIDCDFRRSTIAALFDLEDGPGLRDLRSEGFPHLADLVSASRFDNLEIVRSGSPGIAPAWFPAVSSDLEEEAADLADVVIFDTGPLLATNEASALIPAVDVTVLTTRAGRTAKAQGTRATDLLTQLRATVAGLVLIGSESSKKYGYYYTPVPGAQKASDSSDSSDEQGSGEHPEPWISGRPGA